MPPPLLPPPFSPHIPPLQAVRQLADILTFSSVGARPSGDRQHTADPPCSHGHEATQPPHPQAIQPPHRQTNQPPHPQTSEHPHPQTDQRTRGAQHPQATQNPHPKTNQDPHPRTTEDPAPQTSQPPQPQATQHSPVAQYPQVAQLLRSMGEDVMGYEREREGNIQVRTVAVMKRRRGAEGISPHPVTHFPDPHTLPPHPPCTVSNPRGSSTAWKPT